ncbi:RNA polymerase II degradation factor 1 isoform X4 [Drosophila sechellia]|uniref:RNA polymerase II degradation factor 1 isoform X4 n=1 Tax=Drosophila sechellia TaxID=7238 RepID=UPI0013DE0536|nr:RNA polymerase II degradation factor 1 isoform X4 [Drosophila sechellia]
MWMPKGRWSDWLLPLAFVAILVTSSQATGSASQPAPINRNPRGSHNNSGIGDSELSASERSRRLIPYMAFYLPAPELPINQQYATKHSSSAGGAQLQAPLPGPGRIPVPVAYMPQQKHHPHHHGPPHPPPVPHYQSGAGEVYHSLAIGGHQHQHAPPQPPPGHVKEQQAITNSGATYIAYKPLNPTHKHKTVQHFPPLPPSPKEQVQQQQQQQHQHHLLLHHQQQQQQPQQYEILSPSLVASQAQRQRGKQSKINLTPFTAQNTLPGQFIPIIYTPVSSSKPGSPGDAINYNNIQSNLKQPEIVYKNSHQTQIVTDYAAGADASAEQSPPSSSGEEVDEAKGEKMVEQQQEEHGAQEEAAEQQQQQPQQHQQVQNNPSSPAPPQFIDYLIDGPRQSLEDEQQHSQHERPSAHQPPQHAYILVTTTAPHIEHQPAPQMHPEISTPRPPILYNQQPTLRLQPVHTYKATRRPIYVTTPAPAVSPTSSHTVEITPKYVYVSGKPPTAHNPELPLREPSTVTPIKLKPVYKYAHERPPLTPAYVPEDQDQLPDIRTSSLAEILHKLQASNHLPQTLTPDNIDNSIKTLIRILQNLKQTQTIVANPPQHHEEHKSNSQDYDYNTGSEEEHHSQSEEAVARPKGPNKHPGPSTGRPGIDYPNYAEIPQTSFECTKQRYKGFFGDPETNCQVWHYCDLNGGKASFLCPNGTIFSQIALTCDWWFNVKCSTTAQLYVLNERLYKYILPFNPKFPEDYNGPIVDKYLAMKFQEMEEKMRLEKQRKAAQEAQKPEEAPSTLPALPKNHKPEPKHGSGINAQVYEQSSEKNLLIDDEIDDISERGTYDTYDQTAPTTIMAPTSTQDTQSFVLKPIVVSSTPQPLPEIDFEVEPTAPGSSEEEDHLQSLRETKEAEKNTRESTRVSVEKLEVIEIKTDGNTGQLMPIKTSSK